MTTDGELRGSTLLLCLPHAGAGPEVFRSWNKFDVEGVRVHPVELPGHGRRIGEAAYTDVLKAVDAAVSDLRPLLVGGQGQGQGQRVALFGHCLGALQCFELARRLREMDGVTVSHLFVSGSPGPFSTREERVTDVEDDDEFLAELRRIAGYHDPAMDDRELRELKLPMLRADVRMHEDYRPSASGPLDVPITAIRGREDDVVSADEIAQWRDLTTGGFAAVELAGGHMYFMQEAAGVLGLVGVSVR